MYKIQVISGSFYSKRLYQTGDIFLSETNLSEKFPEKYLLLESPPSESGEASTDTSAKRKFGVRKDKTSGFYNVINLTSGKKYNDEPLDKEAATSLRDTLEND